MATATQGQNQTSIQRDEQNENSTQNLPTTERESEKTKQRNNVQARRDERLARALGWFSISLGAAQILAPRGLARFIGVNPRPALLRMLGAREITSGIGILTGGRKPAGAMWSRVAGDAMDLALLGAALTSPASKKGRVAAAAAAVAGVTALDVICSQNLSRSQNDAAETKIEIERSITVGKSASELYSLWREPNTLRQIMRHFAEITPLGANAAHWKINALPLGRVIEWNTNNTEDRAGEFISWKSADQTQFSNEGSVSFRPATGNRGTVVTLRFRFAPPGGAAGMAAAKLFDFVPDKLVGQSLRSFKSLAETGEIPTLERNSSARGTGDAV